VTALVCAVLQKLVGAAGTLLTIIVIMMFGNPSSGGSIGVPYLPAFWRAIGPFLLVPRAGPRAGARTGARTGSGARARGWRLAEVLPR
jgi:hypothetical protein